MARRRDNGAKFGCVVDPEGAGGGGGVGSSEDLELRVLCESDEERERERDWATRLKGSRKFGRKKAR